MSSAIEMQPLTREPKSNITLSPLAGKPAPREMQVEVAQLEREYFAFVNEAQEIVNNALR
jgi:hypothetical protein